MNGRGKVAGLTESRRVKGKDMKRRRVGGRLDDTVVLCEHPEVSVSVKRDIVAVAERCVTDGRILLPLSPFLIRVDSADAFACRRPDAVCPRVLDDMQEDVEMIGWERVVGDVWVEYILWIVDTHHAVSPGAGP